LSECFDFFTAGACSVVRTEQFRRILDAGANGYFDLSSMSVGEPSCDLHGVQRSDVVKALESHHAVESRRLAGGYETRSLLDGKVEGRNRLRTHDLFPANFEESRKIHGRERGILGATIAPAIVEDSISSLELRA